MKAIKGIGLYMAIGGVGLMVKAFRTCTRAISIPELSETICLDDGPDTALMTIGAVVLGIAAVILLSTMETRLERIRPLSVIALIGAVVSWLAAISLWRVALDDWSSLSNWMLRGLALVLVPLGGYFFTLTRRASLPTAAEVLAADERNPILFLRPFSFDASQPSSGGSPSPLMLSASYWTGGGSRTLEEAVCEALSEAGPVVALGRPGERLPPLGAARVYSAGDWRQEVTELIAESEIVCMVVGASAGLDWEFDYLATAYPLCRLLLVVPDWSDWPEFVRRAAGEGKPALPPTVPRDAIAVRFGRDGRPVVVRGTKDVDSYRDVVRDVVRGLWPDMTGLRFRADVLARDR